MLIVLVPSIFVYPRIFVSCFKKVLICPQRLWTARKRRLSFFLCSSDLLGIQRSDTRQRLAFFSLRHANACTHFSSCICTQKKWGFYLFFTYSKVKINAELYATFNDLYSLSNCSVLSVHVSSFFSVFFLKAPSVT